MLIRYGYEISLTCPQPTDVMDALHEELDPWLGKPRHKQTEGRVTFGYRFECEETPPVPLRLKVEIKVAPLPAVAAEEDMCRYRAALATPATR